LEEKINGKGGLKKEWKIFLRTFLALKSLIPKEERIGIKPQ